MSPTIEQQVATLNSLYQQVQDDIKTLEKEIKSLRGIVFMSMKKKK